MLRLAALGSIAVLAACQRGAGADGDGDSGGSGTVASSTTATADTADGTADTGTSEPAVFWLRFDDDLDELDLMRDDEPLLRFPRDAFQLGMVDAFDDTLSYDPVYELDVAWATPASIELADDPGDPIVLALSLLYDDGTTASISFAETAPGRFHAVLSPASGLIAAIRLRPRADATEGFYGLGEVFDTPNHRGKARAMQLEADLTQESGNNEAHVPVPLLVGTRGWGLFVPDDHPALFEVATDEDDLVQVTFGMGAAGDAGLELHLFAAEHPLDVTAHYYAVTATPVRPAPWAVGPWVWRNENMDQAEVLADAATIRALDLPTSALWIDRPYATGVNTFDFEAARFPDPDAMIAELHALGFRVALWHAPYASADEEPAAEQHQEAIDGGFFPPVVGVLTSGWGAPIDFTNPDAWDWWQANLHEYTDRGIEGFKLDYGEDVLAGFASARVQWAFADGSDEHTMHARYQELYHRAYAELLPAAGGFLLARRGVFGDQANVSVIWPGDLAADMSRHGDDADGKAGVGGLPAAVAASLSLGPSGFPLFASDTGGYRGAPPSKETFTRWFQFTALTPVMQIGTAANDVAWEPSAGNGFDEEMLGWYRDFTRLHLRLFPYLWTHVQRVAVDGRPIQRALGLAYPELGVHPADVYLLGDDLLVAPVVEAGADTRTLLLPPGRWVEWHTGVVHEGGEEITIDAPLAVLPLFLREGGIVPLLRPTIDSLAPTTEPAMVDSFATDPGVLYPRIFAGGAGSFSLYDGSRIEQSFSNSVLTVVVHPGDDFDEGALVELMARPNAPSEVLLDGEALAQAPNVDALAATAGWVHTTERGGTLHVRLPEGEHAVTATF
ncbi:MAG TPA: TIM-barrel domain-containing protein [Nannocystaceae bacterium]|nr:TIM-barrel domain-containing protein [Nannocystaceae bacterium]